MLNLSIKIYKYIELKINYDKVYLICLKNNFFKKKKIFIYILLSLTSYQYFLNFILQNEIKVIELFLLNYIFKLTYTI